jgi:hypothetical protein
VDIFGSLVIFLWILGIRAALFFIVVYLVVLMNECEYNGVHYNSFDELHVVDRDGVKDFVVWEKSF